MWRRVAVLCAVALFLMQSSYTSFAYEGPSFDCSHGVRQTLAAILCGVPAASEADWELSNAYWALYTDDREETAFGQSVNRRCALPPLETDQEQAGRMMLQGIGSAVIGAQFPFPGPRMLTQNHVRCVIDSFRERASQIKSKLSGDALRESNYSPEQHIEIQQALAQKGLMKNKIKTYGVNADGQFGPNTRSALADFQRSIGAPPTGFLTEEQRLALVESPEQRQVRESRIAAEAQAVLDAKQAREKADSDAKLRQERAAKEAADRETARLQEEAKKASE